MNRHELTTLSGRVEALLDEVRDAGDTAEQVRADRLVAAVMELYAAGLARVVELVDDDTTLRALADDELVGGLLLLHDLHPDDVDTRIQAALDRVRPYLGSHAGGIAYHGVDDEGVAHLTLQGSCDGCPSSSVTVQLSVESAVLEAAPEVTSVDVVGLVAPAATPPLLQIGLRPGLEHGSSSEEPEASQPAWEHLESVPETGSLSARTVAGAAVLFAAVSGTVYAYLDGCARCEASLADATVVGDRLTCQRCGTTYDARLAGREVGSGEEHLTPLPLLRDGVGWRLALPGSVPA